MFRIVSYLLFCFVVGDLVSAEIRRDFSIPMLDLTTENELFSTVERAKGYLGILRLSYFRDEKHYWLRTQTDMVVGIC